MLLPRWEGLAAWAGGQPERPHLSPRNVLLRGCRHLGARGRARCREARSPVRGSRVPGRRSVWSVGLWVKSACGPLSSSCWRRWPGRAPAQAAHWGRHPGPERGGPWAAGTQTCWGSCAGQAHGPVSGPEEPHLTHRVWGLGVAFCTRHPGCRAQHCPEETKVKPHV